MVQGHSVWQGKTSLLPYEQGRVWFDGIFTDPRLNHPEGIAVDSTGTVWCGGERGEIYKVSADGRSIEQVASTGGFTLGLAFHGDEWLYSCDLKHAAVFRLHTTTGRIERFADGDGNGRRMSVPNMPVVDAAKGALFVSDSFDAGRSGPGIWKLDLQTGQGGMWYDYPLTFANGLALSPDGSALYVAETFARTISRIPILADGSAGEKECVITVDALPDGIAFDRRGRLYIGCYEPSLIYRWSPAGGMELLFYDPEAHLLCHPTNVAFRGSDLLTSNLGRWHITEIRNAAELD